MDPNNATIEEVIEVLKRLDDEHLQISDYYKTIDFLFYHNITQYDAKRAIRSLTTSDLFKGPVDDDNPKRNYPVWIFKKHIFNCMCYIKLKIINKGKVAVVISFHEDENSLLGGA